jgi:hypothetical protein
MAEVSKTVKVYNLIKNAADLDAMSKKLAGDIVANDDLIQSYLLSEIVHIEEHRNTTRLNRFFTTIRGTGVRVNAMLAFVEVFGNVKYHQSPETNDKDPLQPSFKEFFTVKPIRKAHKYFDAGKWNHVKDMDAIVRAASAKPWYKFRPERKAPPFIMENRFKTFMKSVFETANDPGKEDKIDMDFAADLAAIAVKHGFNVDSLLPTGFVLPTSNIVMFPGGKEEQEEQSQESTTEVETPAVIKRPRAIRTRKVAAK